MIFALKSKTLEEKQMEEQARAVVHCIELIMLCPISTRAYSHTVLCSVDAFYALQNTPHFTKVYNKHSIKSFADFDLY